MKKLLSILLSILLSLILVLVPMISAGAAVTEQSCPTVEIPGFMSNTEAEAPLTFLQKIGMIFKEIFGLLKGLFL